ncbi:flagellar hook-associated protein FlgL [Pseudoalteromonas sp. MMG024]|uniref:flagellar hook-associated protein FlgL n=1 Tax=Pseudoalteromonas sp. MMG024 TaxID=2909980 RepID=UPI001F01E74B|nr:flagellar hook-associated protein FlgL [Pseudoalteromonas sp. MMG024]MCF6457026.1 flagellar hook-associated protein FlgL [Pseudoalteromonas sp. MMG024]
MRLSNNIMYQNSLDSILSGQEKLVDSQLRVNTQKKVLTAADDPAAMAQANLITKKLELNDQFDKNMSFLRGRLEVEENALKSMNTQIERARELSIQAGNGAYTHTDREGISKELAEIQKSLLDLMNTRSEDGRFIFSGFQDSKAAYSYDSASQTYTYNGDQGNHSIQVATSTYIQATDNGADLFEKTKARLNVASNAMTILPGAITAGSVYVKQQAEFDQFHANYYDPLTPANNTFNVVVTAGAPDQYEIRQNGSPLVPAVTGDFTGESIEFAGMEISLQGAAPGQADFTLETPTNKNILNTLEGLISVLENPASTQAQLQETLADSVVELDNAQEAITFTRASIGGRLNAVTRNENANSGEEIVNVATKASLLEADMAEAISELKKNETALQAAQATFGRVSGLTLFDYI